MIQNKEPISGFIYIIHIYLFHVMTSYRAKDGTFGFFVAPGNNMITQSGVEGFGTSVKTREMVMSFISDQ